MSYDDNCSLHTASALFNERNPGANTTPGGISEITGFMEGPGHSAAAISDMLVQLGVSDGTRVAFDSLAEAIAYMKMLRFGAHCAFGYEPTGGGMGHVMVAITSLGGILFEDHQIHERQGRYAPISVGMDSIPAAGHRYTVWRPGVVN